MRTRASVRFRGAMAASGEARDDGIENAEMIELEDFRRHAKKQKKGSFRKALEEGDIKPIPLALPKASEQQRRRNNAAGDPCTRTTKLVLSSIAFTMSALIGYVIWRIRSIEKPPPIEGLTYRIIFAEDLSKAYNPDGT